tara:strand:+ start:475 stop:1038 length:564 start_codon:yes stop_codon:yes gene_type:complete
MKTFKEFITENKDFDKDAWLSQQEYTINPDGTIDINGDVKLSTYSLEKLPFKFGEVTGYFDCSHNQLTSLEGSPKFVGINFDCSYNELTTLEGSPKFVGGYFDCSDNELITLKGCPEHVVDAFYCMTNRIKTIDYLPEYIGGEVFMQLNATKFSPEDIERAINKAKNRKYIKTLEYDEIEGIGDIFD